MSTKPTPETDAAAFNIQPDGSIHFTPKGGYVGRDTCETLETERDALRAEMERLKAHIKGLQDMLETGYRTTED